MKTTVVGLGKLGAPLAAVLAASGHSVVGVDVVPRGVELLAAGRAPVDETDLQEVIDSTNGRLRATNSVAEASEGAEVTFLIVPTPSGPDGSFSLDYLLAAAGEVGAALAAQSDYHVVVVVSTVMPGATMGPIRDVLESASGRRVDDTLGLCYSPEFIALGSVVRDLRNPDFVLIGESGPRAGDVLEAALAPTWASPRPVRRMSVVSAEIAKLAVNTYVTTKISFANVLSEICGGFDDADVDAVTAAIGLDRRIGSFALTAGAAFGGPCFPRDNAAFAHLARTVGAPADLAEATQSVNHHQHDRLATEVLRVLSPGFRVAVAGLAYKPSTPIVEESAGVNLALALTEKGVRPIVFDPKALESARPVLGERVDYADTIEECVRDAEVIVLSTPWPELIAIAGLDLTGKTVVDVWGLLPAGTPGRVRPGEGATHG